jgi:hypothetical protein
VNIIDRSDSIQLQSSCTTTAVLHMHSHSYEPGTHADSPTIQKWASVMPAPCEFESMEENNRFAGGPVNREDHMHRGTFQDYLAAP